MAAAEGTFELCLQDYTEGPCDKCARAHGGLVQQGDSRGRLPEAGASWVQPQGDTRSPEPPGGQVSGPTVQGQELRFDCADKGKPF